MEQAILCIGNSYINDFILPDTTLVGGVDKTEC